jgi:formylglycine-generating enzyme required for sulfatase activity
MIKKHLLSVCLLVLFLVGSQAVAESFSRSEISAMQGAGIRMALPNETPYIIPHDITPERLLKTELLDFSNVKIYNLPAWLKRFKNLRKLDLSNAAITLKGLPETLAVLSQLEFLNLSGNLLFKQQKQASLAAVWEKLPSLQTLKLANIKASASQLGTLASLTQLRTLDVSGNQLSAGLATLQLDQLDYLRTLNLSHNNLSQSPLKHLPADSLVELNLSHNALTKIAFMNLPNLKHWDLSNNGTLHLADEFGGLFSMSQLISLKYDDGSSASDQSYLSKSLRTKLFKRAGGINALGLKMMPIKGGSFQMGCVSGKDCDDDEKPVHPVRIAPFTISTTEVTFTQWDHCVANGGCSHQPSDNGWGRGNRPVINVSWNDTQEFITWLNSLVKNNSCRLPTEAEWEYVARAGTSTKYPWGNDIGENKANCRSCGSCWDKKKTAPVASFKAYGGLYDMQGNVWEWVQDKYHKNYDNAPKNGSAWEFGDSAGRVLRGGSWFDDPGELRSAYRSNGSPDDRINLIGFRFVCSHPLTDH